MRNHRVQLALGLMSGTSLDGIDAALIETDGRDHVRTGAACTVPYTTELREGLRAVLGCRGDEPAVDEAVTRAHAAAVDRLLRDAGVAAAAVDVIGFHGHTILHEPQRRRTRQVGDGRLLARLTGIDVVDDFRSADVAAGGEGAPLAPIYHAALARDLPRPLAVLNIGGVANVTWIGDRNEPLIAFDTGPGNALIDDWVRACTGLALDRDGALAAAGRVDQQFLDRFLAADYFDRPPPKSLDRDDFAFVGRAVDGLTPADGAATLAAFTARSIAAATRHMPRPPVSWVVTGGGRKNPSLMRDLGALLQAEVRPTEAVGWDGDALEAQAFAYLAVRSVQGLPISFPGTTGVPEPLVGGVHHRPG